MPKIQLDDGTEVLILASAATDAFETQGAAGDTVTARLSDVSTQCGQALLETVSGVRSRLQKIEPSKLEIEIGVTLSTEGTVIISSAKAEAAIKVKATWKETES